MEGIDVSAYQGKIDWQKVKNTIDFTYIKMNQGIGGLDPYCIHNATEVSKTGLKFGYYHFATLNIEDVFTDAKQEAYSVINNLNPLPLPSLAIALDVELNTQLNLSPHQVENWIHTFINVLAASKIKTILYSYSYFLDDNLPGNHALGQYPLWLASYTYASFPTLPKGWNQWNIWQFSNKGQVQGISGDVDMNHARILI